MERREIERIKNEKGSHRMSELPLLGGKERIIMIDR